MSLNNSNKDVLILSIDHNSSDSSSSSSDSSFKSSINHHTNHNNNNVIEIKTNGDIVTTPPSIAQHAANNISKINFDYNENDNKTIISLNGDGGEILWDSNRKNSNSFGTTNSGGDGATADIDHNDECDLFDDENDGEEFDLSDSEFEEILDEEDDDDGDGDGGCGGGGGGRIHNDDDDLSSSDHVDSGCGSNVKNIDDNGSCDSSIVKDIIEDGGTIDIINDKNVIKIINNYSGGGSSNYDVDKNNELVNVLSAHDNSVNGHNYQRHADESYNHHDDDDVDDADRVNNLVNKIEIKSVAADEHNSSSITLKNSDNSVLTTFTDSDNNNHSDSNNNNNNSTVMLNETINTRLVANHSTSTPINRRSSSPLPVPQQTVFHHDHDGSGGYDDDYGDDEVDHEHDGSSEVHLMNLHHQQRRKSSLHITGHNHHQFMLHDGTQKNNEDEDEVIVNILGKDNEIAEARLAARRQARAEAREIRMRELERQQKELEQNADRVFDMQTAAGIDPLSRSRIAAMATPTTVSTVRGNSMSSRRSSEDSLEEEGRSLRDLRHEIKEVEERFRKAMIANAQLDNERSSQSYQIQLLKDKLEEMEESHAQLQREYREKCRDHDALKRNNDKVQEELKLVQGQLNERDTLIAEQGLVIVTIEDENGTDARRALVSAENAHLLETTQGALDVRLKKFAADKKQLENDISQLQQQLSEAKTQGRRSSSMNGPVAGDDDIEDVQRESNKLIADYKYKLQKAEQEIASLQASLARSETQVIRYKSTAEAAEKAEAELKIERRKLQRENREATERLEELETSNNHLLKRLDKLKNAKSNLLKEL